MVEQARGFYFPRACRVNIESELAGAYDFYDKTRGNSKVSWLGLMTPMPVKRPPSQKGSQRLRFVVKRKTFLQKLAQSLLGLMTFLPVGVFPKLIRTGLRASGAYKPQPAHFRDFLDRHGGK